MTDCSPEYFEFLQSRRLRSLVYRKLWLYPRLRRHLKGRVLDVGSGIGDFVASCRGAVGVDVNPRLVDWCRSQGHDVRLIENGRIPYDAGCFDSAVLDNVLEHLVDPMPILAEIRRVLTPGGTFIVGVPGPRGFVSAPDHVTFYDRTSLERVVNEAGFQCVRMMRLPIPSEWLSRHMRQWCLYGVFRRTD